MLLQVDSLAERTSMLRQRKGRASTPPPHYMTPSRYNVPPITWSRHVRVRGSGVGVGVLHDMQTWLQDRPDFVVICLKNGFNTKSSVCPVFLSVQCRNSVITVLRQLRNWTGVHVIVSCCHSYQAPACKELTPMEAHVFSQHHKSSLSKLL